MLNTNTKKSTTRHGSSVKQMKESNKEGVYGKSG